MGRQREPCQSGELSAESGGAECLGRVVHVG